MQYYVVAPDGQKYGPADVATLAQWAQEGRLASDSILESMLDASRVPASQVPGIFASGSVYSQPGPTPGPGTTYSAPQQFAAYPRGDTYQGSTLPPEYAGKFNWGAFYFSWIWGLNHKAYLTLITLGLGVVGLIPRIGGIFGLVSLGLGIWYGTQGNQWAWQSGRWNSPDEMMACQKIWATWALWVFLASIVLCGIGFMLFAVALGTAVQHRGGF